ncbi:MAG: TolC family protein [Vicinamibacterales bacterium]
MLVALTLVAALATASLPPSPLTLAEAVARARDDSPLRGAAKSLAEGSAEAARLVGRLPNPLIDVRVENLGPTSRLTLPRDVFAVVSQPLEIAGKRGLRHGIAAAEQNLAGANLQVVDWQITLRTVQLYVQALKARSLFETLTANRDGLVTLIETMRRRVAEGFSAESDLLKFETESARMDIDIARASLELARSLGALTFVIGASAPLTSEQLVEPDAIAAPAVASASMESAIARHPEVHSAAMRLDRARQVAALERARRFPDPVLSAGYKRTSGFDAAVVGVTLTVPLFDRNGSATARAVGEERAATAEHDAIARRLASEAAALIATAEVLSQRAARAGRELLEPADAVRNAARAAFREGTADVLKLIDAERVHGDVRRAAIELRLEALAASLEARLAVGLELLP